MKALIYTGEGSLVFSDAPDPTCAEGEVLVEVHSVGICGSDLHAFHGKDERRPPPLILGHEVSGYMIQQDKRVPVVINPLVTCGTCSACLRGADNICANRQIISMQPREGAFAELLAIPEANVFELPKSVDLTHAALVEPIACGWHAIRLAEQTSHLSLDQMRLLILGAGAVGLGAAISARALGVSELLMVETQPSRRANAEEEGFQVRSPGQFEEASSTFDVVIDAVGLSPTRELASRLLIPGGVLVHIGLGSSEGGFDIRRSTLQELRFVGSYTYTKQHFAEVVTALIENRLGALKWFQVEPLSDGEQWFSALSAGNTACTKLILRP